MIASSNGATRQHSNLLIYSVFAKLRCDFSDTLLLDGGTGEELFRRGVPDDRSIWSAKAVVDNQYHGVLQQVHQDYIRAGSKIITTNSYGIVPGVGFSDADILKHVDTAGRLAREAVDSIQKENKTDADYSQVLVMGSLGPLLESYRPDKLLPHERGLSTYQMIAQTLSPYVDCFLAETMSCFEEVSQAVEGVSKLDDDRKRPMLASYTLRRDGRLRSGEPVASGISHLISFAKDHNVELLGILLNCCEPESITAALKEMQTDTDTHDLLHRAGIVLGAYANRLTEVAPDWSMEASPNPQPFRHDLPTDVYFDKFVHVWIKDYGLKMIGGCCGISPEYISYIASHIQKE